MANNCEPEVEESTKTKTHAPPITMSFSEQKMPQEPKTSGVRLQFSFGNNDGRDKPTFPQYGLEKSSPDGSLALIGGR